LKCRCLQQTSINEKLSGLPGFVHFLENWRIPEELRHGRFGVKTWHHPQLLAALESLAPETRLLGLVDEVIFSDSEFGEGLLMVRGKQTAWKGRAEKLEATLFSSSFGYEAKKLLSWSSATGTYLARLASKRPDRVEKDRSSESRDWIIFPPKSVEAAADKEPPMTP
jgi:hypothetical protein